MTTEEIKEEVKGEEQKVVKIRVTCGSCHNRVYVKPMQTGACPKCGDPLYPLKKTVKAKKKAEKVERKAEKKAVKEKATKKKNGEKFGGSILGTLLYMVSERERKFKATARVEETGICVLKGSLVARPWLPSAPDGVKEKGKELVDTGVIIKNEFVKDYVFKSPSMAAAIVKGRSATGLREWVDKEDNTLKGLMKKL